MNVYVPLNADGMTSFHVCIFKNPAMQNILSIFFKHKDLYCFVFLKCKDCMCVCVCACVWMCAHVDVHKVMIMLCPVEQCYYCIGMWECSQSAASISRGQGWDGSWSIRNIPFCCDWAEIKLLKLQTQMRTTYELMQTTTIWGWWQTNERKRK